MTLAIGDKAPDFTLATQSGDGVRLKDFRGQKLVIFFYPKDNTPGCTKEACGFQAHLKDFRKAGAAVLGISRDSIQSHQKFATGQGLTYPLGSDPETAVIAAYGCWIEKSLYGRTYMGCDRATFLIDQKGRIAALWRKVKVPGHVEAVLAAVKAQP